MQNHEDPRLNNYLNDKYFRGHSVFNWKIIHNKPNILVMVFDTRVVTATLIKTLSKELNLVDLWVICDMKGLEQVNKAYITKDGVSKSAPRYA